MGAFAPHQSRNRYFREGEVVRASVIHAVTPCVALEIRKAISRWRFSPALRNGQPTEVQFLMRVPAARRVHPAAVPRDNI